MSIVETSHSTIISGISCEWPRDIGVTNYLLFLVSETLSTRIGPSLRCFNPSLRCFNHPIGCFSRLSVLVIT